MNNSNQFRGEYKLTQGNTGEQVLIHLSSTHISYKHTDHAQWIQIAFAEIAGMHTYNDSNVVINFGAYPYQSLLIKDPEFLHLLKQQCINHPVVANLFKNSKATFIKLLLVIASILIGLVLLAWFFILPWAVNKAVEKFPVEYEQKFGKVMFDQVKATETIDLEKSRVLNNFFDSLYFKSRYDVQLICVKRDEVNAYALPGGYIVVYDGILNKMQKQEELAGLLAHEFAHISLKHTLKSTFNTLGFSALLQLIFGGFDDSVVGLLGNQTDQLRQLHYSRTLEEEADVKGYDLVKQQAIDPNGMINLFERLKAESGSMLPGILSTHPLPEDRISNIKNLILKDKYSFKPHPSLNLLFDSIKKSSVNGY